MLALPDDNTQTRPGRAHHWSPVFLVMATAIVVAIQVWSAIADSGASYRARGLPSPTEIDGPRIRVNAVVPHSAWDEAGVRVGDVIRFPDALTRTYFFFGMPPSLKALPVILERDGNARPIAVAGSWAPQRTFEYSLLHTLEYAVAIVAVLLAALIVMKRPGTMTWSLWFSILPLCWTSSLAWSWFPAPANVAIHALTYCLFTYAPSWALPRFALRFPTGTLPSRDRLADRIFLGIFALAFLSELVFYYLSDLTLTFPLSWRNSHYFLSEVSASIPVLAATGIVIRNFLEQSGEIRARLRWGVLGVSISGIAYAVQLALGAVTNSTDAWIRYLSSFWGLLSLMLPLSVWYALRQRTLVDARVVVSRATIYTSLTAALVICVAVVDWTVSKLLSGTRIASFVEAAITVILGVVLNAMHGRLERMLEGKFFRQRRDAAVFLHRLAATLPISTDEATIDRALTTDVIDSLKLSSSAVFRRHAQNHECFTRVASIGWSDDRAQELLPDDSLIRFLLTERRTVILNAIHWDRADLPSDLEAPAIAVPLIVRGEVLGVALYGRHRDVTSIEPEEIEIIERFVERAAAALDAVAAARINRRIADYEAHFGTLPSARELTA
jgi:hypothetical protein